MNVIFFIYNWTKYPEIFIKNILIKYLNYDMRKKSQHKQSRLKIKQDEKFKDFVQMFNQF